MKRVFDPYINFLMDSCNYFGTEDLQRGKGLTVLCQLFHVVYPHHAERHTIRPCDTCNLQVNPNIDNCSNTVLYDKFARVQVLMSESHRTFESFEKSVFYIMLCNAMLHFCVQCVCP